MIAIHVQQYRGFFAICYDALVPCRPSAYKKWGRDTIFTEMLPSSNVYLSNIFFTKCTCLPGMS